MSFPVSINFCLDELFRKSKRVRCLWILACLLGTFYIGKQSGH
jgi:hypothetical protein